MDYTETTIKKLNRYNGLITNTRVDIVKLQNGNKVYREVVEHPGGVTIIPVDDEGYVYCVRQYRYPFQIHLLEVPAGKLEKGEDPLEAAKRELSEETGITANKYINLGEIYTSPGFCTEILYIYLASDLCFGKSHPDEDEFLDVEKIHINKLYEEVMKNKIVDCKTIVAVLKAKTILENR